MPFDAADLSAFLDPTMPGYALAMINEVAVGGLFRRPYAESFGMVGGDNPAFRALSDSLLAVRAGDRIEINAAHYTVASVRPDGAGMTLLDLK